jgi:hypothetical protein
MPQPNCQNRGSGLGTNKNASPAGKASVLSRPVFIAQDTDLAGSSAQLSHEYEVFPGQQAIVPQVVYGHSVKLRFEAVVRVKPHRQRQYGKATLLHDAKPNQPSQPATHLVLQAVNDVDLGPDGCMLISIIFRTRESADQDPETAISDLLHLDRRLSVSGFEPSLWRVPEAV